jgi:hypothetical protein
MKTCVSGLNALFRCTKDLKHPFYSNWTKMIYVTVTKHFSNLVHIKIWKLVFRAWLHYFGGTKVEKHPFYSMGTKMINGSVSGLNALFWGTKVAKMLSQQKRLFYSIRHKMMFGSVSEHFNNLLHVKRCKTCVLGLNALFRGTKVAKHPFYSIGPKLIYRNVTKHFTNLLHVKRCKTCVSGLNALFWVPKLSKCFCNKSIHSTPLDPKWCLGVFQSISIIVCT